jgi:hypothetical protein
LRVPVEEIGGSPCFSIIFRRQAPDDFNFCKMSGSDFAFCTAGTCNFQGTRNNLILLLTAAQAPGARRMGFVREA